MKNLSKLNKWGLVLGFFIALAFFGYYSLPKTNHEKSLPTETVEEGFLVDIPQRGYYKSKTIVTLAATEGTVCELSFITPDGVESKEEGLDKTTANADGLCRWIFVIEDANRKGSGRLIFYLNGHSETHFMELRQGY